MSRTLFDTSDAGTVKKWSSLAMAETARKSYVIDKLMGSEEQKLPVVIRNDLESGPGDEVTVYLVAKFVGRPIQGDEKAQGRATRLTDYTDKVRIERQRRPVNIGDIMAQKRRPYDLKMQAVDRLSDYWAEYFDEEASIQLSGRRGTGANIQHLPLGYTGFPVTTTAFDSSHLVYPNAVAAANALTTSDTMGAGVIEGLALMADTMIGGSEGAKIKMQQCEVEGGRYWLCIMHPCGMFDLRREVGEAGWLALEKARATAIGSNSPIFKGEGGATAMLNRVILHAWNSITYQDDYGASSNIRGFRALFLGAHAAAVAFGTKGRNAKAPRLQLGESDEDYGDEAVLKSQIVMGMKRTRFNGYDFAAIACDHAASATALAKQMS